MFVVRLKQEAHVSVINFMLRGYKELVTESAEDPKVRAIQKSTPHHYRIPDFLLLYFL